MKTTEDRVKMLVAETFDVQVDAINVTANLADFGGDNLSPVIFTMAIEDDFELHVDDEDAEKWVTVQDAVDYVVRRTAGRTP